MAGNRETTKFEDKTALEPWFSYTRFASVIGDVPVEVVNAPLTWDKRHVRRLLDTTKTAGLVPTISATINEGHLQIAQLQLGSPNLRQRLAMSRNLLSSEAAALVAAVAKATDAGHLLGLRHGALTPSDVLLVSGSIAIGGMGLGHGGTVDEARMRYAAPEVKAGEPAGVRSDVYSLGRILEAAFVSANNRPSWELRQVVKTATKQDFMDRYRTAGQVAEAIELAIGVGVKRHRLATFDNKPLSEVPKELAVPAGLFGDETIIDLTN